MLLFYNVAFCGKIATFWWWKFVNDRVVQFCIITQLASSVKKSSRGEWMTFFHIVNKKGCEPRSFNFRQASLIFLIIVPTCYAFHRTEDCVDNSSKVAWMTNEKIQFIRQQEAQSHCNIFLKGGTEMIDWTYRNWCQKNFFRQKKVVDGDLDGRIQANLRNKTRDSSV